MKGLQLPPNARLVLGGLFVAGAVSLALAFPPERVLGAMFEADQQLEVAARYYRAWSLRYPRDYEARWHTAELFLQTARPDEAVACLDEMARDWPGDARILERLLETEDSLLRVETSIARVEALAGARRNDPRIVGRLADYYRWFGHTEALIQSLDRLTRMGDYPDARAELSDILLAKRRYDELIELLTRDLDAMPDEAEVRLALYEAYLRTGRIEQALVELRSVLRLEPDRIEHLRELAERLIALGRWPEALRVYDERLAADPHSRALHADLLALYQTVAEILARQGDRAKAIAVARRRARMAPNDIAIRLDLADLHGRRANKVAIVELRKLLRRDPESVDGWSTLAERLSWQGDLAGAIKGYRTALTLAPGRHALRRKLAQHLLWANREAESIAAYQRLVATEKDVADEAVLVQLLIDAERPTEAIPRARSIVAREPTLRHRRLLAEAAYDANDCATALPELRIITAQQPKEVSSWRRMGACATTLGLADEALRALVNVEQANRAPRRGRRPS